MISLFLDSSDKKVIVGILKEEKIIDSIIEDNDNHLLEKFLPLISKLIDKNNLTINEINRIYLVNGPGSFTGVRIGVTTAKVIAWGLKKEIVTISELELLATTKTSKKYIIPYIDARREAVYAGMYDNNLNNMFDDAYITEEKLINKLKRRTRLDDCEFVSYYNNFDNTITPNIDIEKIVEKHKNDKSINPHEVVPNYLKKTEAEENYDKRS